MDTYGNKYNTLIFRGKIINLEEFAVSWTNDNDESFGPYNRTIITVEISKIIKGSSPVNDNIIKVLYAMPLSNIGDSVAESYFESDFSALFQSVWQGLIVGEKQESSSTAHIIVYYDAVNQPASTAARVTFYSGDSNRHIRINQNDANLVFYRNAANYSSQSKRVLSGHELGHLWGIDDIYQIDANGNALYTNLDSIYSMSYNFTQATRHDKNALRIGLNNLWYEPSTEIPWYYQSAPNVFVQRGDVNEDGSINAADARLALQHSSQLNILSGIPLIVADVDGDGRVQATDARLILNYSSQMITVFPADS